MKAKLVKSILIIIFVMMSFNIVVFAEEGGSNISKVEEGDNVIYSFNLTPGSKIQATDFVLSYKDEVLEFLEMSNGFLSETENTMMGKNHVPEEKKIYCSYASLNPNEEGGTILNVRFKKLQDTTNQPVIGIDIKDQYRGDNTEMVDKKITGDNSVASIIIDKSINDADSGAIILSASNEIIPNQGKKSSANNPDQGKKPENIVVDNPNEVEKTENAVVNNPVQKNESLEKDKNKIVLVVIAIGLLMFIVAVLVFLKKKNKGNY
ncbi:MAG: cohesin domain-containing protein [Eubacterium sp.]